MESIPTTIPETVLAVSSRGLVKRFGAKTALDGLDLTVPRGSVYALVGPNGSGKTTTFRILLDQTRADSGSAELFGLDPASSGPRVRAGLGYVPERYDFGYAWMRVGRMIRHHSRYYPGWDRTYAEHLSRALGIPEKSRFGSLSKGEGRRVQLLLALAHRPPLLIMDEPMDGLDPLARDLVQTLLAEHLAATPTTVLVATHLIHLVERLTDSLGVLRNGRIVAQVRRENLERFLRSYRAEVPEGWPGAGALERTVLRRTAGKGEITWTVWGEEKAVRRALTGSGATVREVAPVSLEEAVLAFLTFREDTG